MFSNTKVCVKPPTRNNPRCRYLHTISYPHLSSIWFGKFFENAGAVVQFCTQVGKNPYFFLYAQTIWHIYKKYIEYKVPNSYNKNNVAFGNIHYRSVIFDVIGRLVPDIYNNMACLFTFIYLNCVLMHVQRKGQFIHSSKLRMREKK